MTPLHPIASAVTDAAGSRVAFDGETSGRIAFDTDAGGHYVITGVRPEKTVAAPRDLQVSLPEIRLAWTGEAGVVYNVYRALDGAPGYEKVAERLPAPAYQDMQVDFAAHEVVTYKVTACRADGSGESAGPVWTINHATPLDLARYRHRIRQLNA